MITQKEWEIWKDNFCQHISDWSYFSASDELEQMKSFLLEQQRNEIVKEIREANIWKLVPETPRMIMCSDKEFNELLKKIINKASTAL